MKQRQESNKAISSDSGGRQTSIQILTREHQISLDLSFLIHEMGDCNSHTE